MEKVIWESVKIGSIELSFNGQHYWLTQTDGEEGMSVSKEDIEKLLQDYYDENF